MRRILFLVVCSMMICFASIAQNIPTKEEFIRVCDSLGIYHPCVVYAQARLESGNFKTKYYNRTNNCLGIYDSKKKRYKVFNNWIECLVSYRDEIQHRWKYKECKDEEYLDWIISIGYAADKDYRNKILRIMKNTENY